MGLYVKNLKGIIMMQIEIGISEHDLDQFREKLINKNETIIWTFQSNTGEYIETVFMNQDELDQRKQ